MSEQWFHNHAHISNKGLETISLSISVKIPKDAIVFLLLPLQTPDFTLRQQWERESTQSDAHITPTTTLLYSHNTLTSMATIIIHPQSGNK